MMLDFFCIKDQNWFLPEIANRFSTIRSAVFPSQSGMDFPRFQFPANNFSIAGLIALGLVPNNSLVPKDRVSGRSVLSRSVMQGTPITRSEEHTSELQSR